MVTATTPTAEIKTFYAAAQRANDGKDITLFIAEDQAPELDEAYWKALDGKMRYILLNDPYAAETLTQAVVDAQLAHCPIVIDVAVDPHPLVISLFDRISRYGMIDPPPKDDGTQDESIAVSSPIMVVIKRNLLEHGISYPNFYSLFGPGLSIV